MFRPTLSYSFFGRLGLTLSELCFVLTVDIGSSDYLQSFSSISKSKRVLAVPCNCALTASSSSYVAWPFKLLMREESRERCDVSLASARIGLIFRDVIRVSPEIDSWFSVNFASCDTDS